MGLAESPHITCLVTFHSEGMLAYRTLRSLREAGKQAAQAGIEVEILCILDKAGAETRAFFENPRFRSLWDRKECCELGDAGLARNFGITQARGEYVFIMDGDDLVSPNWFVNCYQTAQAGDPKTIYHAEWLLTFGRQWAAWRQQPQDSDACFLPNHLLHNYWCALCFARREVFQTIPYAYADHTKGFGYEDMHWNCETLARGYTHRPVMGTTHFVRMKEEQSRNLLHLAKKVALLPSQFFTKEVFLKFAGSHQVETPNLKTALKREQRAKLTEALRNFRNELWRLVFSGKTPLQTRLGLIFLTGYRIVHLVLVKPVIGLMPKRFQSWYRRVMHKGVKRLPQPVSHLTLPDSLVAQMIEAAEIEPELAPTPNTLIRVFVAVPIAKESLLVQYYLNFLRQWGDRSPDDLIFLPENEGEAETLRIRNYLERIDPMSPQTLVISGSEQHQKLVREVLPQATFLSFPTGPVFFERMERVLCKIVLQTAPQRLHVLSSPLMTGFVKSFALVCSQYSEIYFSMRTEQDEDFQKELLNTAYLRQAHIGKFVSEEAGLLRLIQITGGLDPSLTELIDSSGTVNSLPQLSPQPSC